ncbi:MAG: XisH family protein [Caldilineaceae bacterium]|nr:XisH family protein [Caldilineaceae bacterium]
MPRLDYLHNTVKNALTKAGWMITDDPLRISFGIRKVYVDLGAEKSLLAAEKGTEKIAVEIKSFLGVSKMNDLENAIGQYIVYRTYLHEVEPARLLYLAIDSEVYTEVFYDISGRILLDVNQIKLIVVDVELEEITEWIN